METRVARASPVKQLYEGEKIGLCPIFISLVHDEKSPRKIGNEASFDEGMELYEPICTGVRDLVSSMCLVTEGLYLDILKLFYK